MFFNAPTWSTGYSVCMLTWICMGVGFIPKQSNHSRHMLMPAVKGCLDSELFSCSWSMSKVLNSLIFLKKPGWSMTRLFPFHFTSGINCCSFFLSSFLNCLNTFSYNIEVPVCGASDGSVGKLTADSF